MRRGEQNVRSLRRSTTRGGVLCLLLAVVAAPQITRVQACRIPTAPLRRLVVVQPARRAVLRAVARFTDLRTLDLVLSAHAVRPDLRALAPLVRLDTLLLSWRDRPPRMPDLPALRMLVGHGHVDEPFVAWMSQQPALRTVHVACTDEALERYLPRVRAHTIDLDGVQGIIPGRPPAPAPDPLEGFIDPARQ